MGTTSTNAAWDGDDTGPQEQPVVVPHRSHKDTRRWCKGRPGRDHQPVTLIPENISQLAVGRPPACKASSWAGSGWLCFHAVVCSNCGKHLRGWGFLEPQECPDYDDAAAREAVARRTRR